MSIRPREQGNPGVITAPSMAPMIKGGVRLTITRPTGDCGLFERRVAA